jgi:hyperosmotically inducible protein
MRDVPIRWISALALAAALGGCTAQQQADARDNAQQATKSVPSGVKDAYLTAAVAAALAGVDVDAATSVKTTAHDGAVTLSGQAHSDAERAQYVAAAKAVDGVSSVRDVLSLNPKIQGPKEQGADATLQARISAAIAAQAGINVFHVDVTVRAGAVTLSGNVPSRSTATTIAETVRGVSGVKTVTNHIAIAK